MSTCKMALSRSWVLVQTGPKQIVVQETRASTPLLPMLHAKVALKMIRLFLIWISSPYSVEVGASFELACQPIEGLNLSTAFSVPDVLVVTETEESFGGMLIEDAGSSHDLRNLCPGGGAFLDESIPECNWTNHPPCEDVPKESIATPAEEKPHFSAKAEVKTIKATYREDIIRFRLSLSCGILKLQEEVAKGLKLEMGTFDVKYLDDDHEWVLIACDADLQECADISRSSGSNIIRLLVNDRTANLGSSCESSG